MMEVWIHSLSVANSEEAKTLKASSESLSSLLAGVVNLANGDLEGLTQFALNFGSFDSSLI